MRLVIPSLRHETTFAQALAEMLQDGPAEFWNGIGPPASIAEYIELRNNHARGHRLPTGWIPATTYWLVDGDELIGEINIRHELTEFLREVGGHIGYWIRPSKRLQGHGTTILKLGIEKAKSQGIEEILITCDETNEGSRRIIEANGGVMEKTTVMGEGIPRKLLFWIRV